MRLPFKTCPSGLFIFMSTTGLSSLLVQRWFSIRLFNLKLHGELYDVLKSETLFPSQRHQKFFAVGPNTFIPLGMRVLVHCERLNCQKRKLLIQGFLLLSKIVVDLTLIFTGRAYNNLFLLVTVWRHLYLFIQAVQRSKLGWRQYMYERNPEHETTFPLLPRGGTGEYSYQSHWLTNPPS